MEKKIFILGASGFAKEVYDLIASIGNNEIMAFVDKDEGNPLFIYNQEIPVISEDYFLAKYNPSTAVLAMGIGNPNIIKLLSQKFSKFDFPNFIHPSSICRSEVKIGRGNIIAAGVIMTIEIKVGDFNIFNLSTTVGHEVVIGNFNVINPSVNISGSVRNGNGNLSAVGAVILQNRVIGKNSVIGASSLVTKNIGDNLVVVGVPAKKMNP